MGTRCVSRSIRTRSSSSRQTLPSSGLEHRGARSTEIDFASDNATRNGWPKTFMEEIHRQPRRWVRPTHRLHGHLALDEVRISMLLDKVIMIGCGTVYAKPGGAHWCRIPSGQELSSEFHTAIPSSAKRPGRGHLTVAETMDTIGDSPRSRSGSEGRRDREGAGIDDLANPTP